MGPKIRLMTGHPDDTHDRALPGQGVDRVEGVHSAVDAPNRLFTRELPLFSTVANMGDVLVTTAVVRLIDTRDLPFHVVLQSLTVAELHGNAQHSRLPDAGDPGRFEERLLGARRAAVLYEPR